MTEQCVKQLKEMREKAEGFADLSVEQLVLEAIYGTSLEEVNSVINTTDWGAYVKLAKDLDEEEEARELRELSSMNFGDALQALRGGERVARAGWNGKGMWIVLMTGMTLPPFNDQTADRKVNDRTAKWIGEDTPLVTLPYLAMWTADGKWLPGWLASQTDMLADDWMVVK